MDKVIGMQVTHSAYDGRVCQPEVINNNAVKSSVLTQHPTHANTAPYVCMCQTSIIITHLVPTSPTWAPHHPPGPHITQMGPTSPTWAPHHHLGPTSPPGPHIIHLDPTSPTCAPHHHLGPTSPTWTPHHPPGPHITDLGPTSPPGLHITHLDPTSPTWAYIKATHTEYICHNSSQNTHRWPYQQ